MITLEGIHIVRPEEKFDLVIVASSEGVTGEWVGLGFSKLADDGGSYAACAWPELFFSALTRENESGHNRSSFQQKHRLFRGQRREYQHHANHYAGELEAPNRHRHGPGR